jgi:hypothetical protein
MAALRAAIQPPKNPEYLSCRTTGGSEIPPALINVPFSMRNIQKEDGIIKFIAVSDRLCLQIN